jgi:hypothetical protein
MGSKGFGQPRLELLDAGLQPVGAVVGCEQVGLQRGPGNRRTAALTVAGWLGFGGVDFLQQVTVSVEEAAVDAGCAGDGGDTDLGALRDGIVQCGQDTPTTTQGLGVATVDHCLSMGCCCSGDCLAGIDVHLVASGACVVRGSAVRTAGKPSGTALAAR